MHVSCGRGALLAVREQATSGTSTQTHKATGRGGGSLRVRQALHILKAELILVQDGVVVGRPAGPLHSHLLTMSLTPTYLEQGDMTHGCRKGLAVPEMGRIILQKLVDPNMGPACLCSAQR